MRWLLLSMLLLSGVEIGVFIWVGGMIGPWWVALLIILTGIIGVSLAKQQGVETWKKAQISMRNGAAPTSYIIDGICILIGGIFLFTPGFVTDIGGFILVIPFTRAPFKTYIGKLISKMMSNNTIIYRK
ncbi:FxsA family protein [Oceanobacillus manasiensis]|uniref:FxsA family protein n=1 Tax=Oceanobacillus manasiensis TaxID=586413 RepID=UPI0005A84FE7|nr:FxsA family protein [Oceanobacillus manasiensis]